MKFLCRNRPEPKLIFAHFAFPGLLLLKAVRTAGAFVCFFLITALAVRASVVVDDPFTDGSRTNATGGDTAGLVYYRNTTSATAPLTVADDSGGIGQGNALFFSPDAGFQKITAFFPSIALANTGDFLRISFVYRFNATPPAVGDGFRWGLYNSNGTRATSDTTTTSTRYDDQGYGWAMNAGGGGSFKISKEASGTNDDILGGSAYFSGFGTSGTLPVAGTAPHTLTFEITRLANGDLQMRGQIDSLTAASGTLAAASVVTYTLDEFAIGFGGTGSQQACFFDRVQIIKGILGSVSLTSPAPDALLDNSSPLTLTATAVDADGIARVEFYNGAQKLGEATTAPYTLTLANPSPGIYGLTAKVVDSDGAAVQSSVVAVRVNGAAQDEFDLLRSRWRTIITGGTGFTIDSDVQSRINSITSGANSNWSSMDKTAGRTALWSDLASTTNSSDLTATYNRLRSMAVAWATYGSSLNGNAALSADIISGLQWMYANRYNENLSYYDNWYDWEIGVPHEALLDIVTLLYDALTPTQIVSYLAATEKFTPNGEVSPVIGVTTGANRVWEIDVVGRRGLLLKRSEGLAAMRDGLSPVFAYVTSGDGFYADGSFIQHGKHPYTGGYGNGLLSSLVPELELLAGSTWDITDPNVANVYRWVSDAFEPLVYRGGFMGMARGREISRSGAPDHATGHGTLLAVLRLAQFAPSANAPALRSLAKSWLQTDTYRNALTSDGLTTVVLAKQLLADSSVTAKAELVGHWNYSSMDRVVHRQPGWGFGLSLRSARIYNYEAINSENLKGWYTGEGATWLYTADLGQFDDFWPTVNPYRLPGTTVDTLTRADSSGQSTANAVTWTGGAALASTGYGAAGMELAAYGNSLTGRKSWFMFDNEVVALGAGINSTDNRTIETILENRKLATAGDVFTVDGAAQPAALGWSATLPGAHWCQLAGVGGYYFPGGAGVKALREARSGSWSLVNASGSATTLTRNFLTLWLDHGANPVNATYAYAILPNFSVSETSAYAASPQFDVLENTPQAQGVKEWDPLESTCRHASLSIL